MQQRPAEQKHSVKTLQAPERRGEAEALSRTQLWSCIRDLVGTLAVPATWRGSDPKSIVDSLLDMLTALVPLEFAFASLAMGAGRKEYFYKSSRADRSAAPPELARLLEGQFREPGPMAIANPFGENTLRVVSFPLGFNAKWGTVAAASSHDEFPSQTERLLLTVASNQAVLALEDVHSCSVEAEKLRLQAEKLRSEMELSRLRAHLQPHFLLNTLNAIAGLVTADPREARRLLVCLGDLLRDSLRDGDEMQTLDEQLAWLRSYAAILEARHAGHLIFRWEIDDQARSVLVPRLLLQPLVENAVQHGTRRRSGGGEVTIRAKLAEADGVPRRKLVCIVEDNGPGVAESEARTEGFGLFAVRRRLALKYGDKASLRLESSSSGTRCILELPAERRRA